jgi:hypothetical protein
MRWQPQSIHEARPLSVAKLFDSLTGFLGNAAGPHALTLDLDG